MSTKIRPLHCGPERSLRTSPSSSSLSPPATAFGFPRAYRRPALRESPTRQAVLLESLRTLGRSVCLAFFSASGCGGVSCGARPRPAARAASWGLRAVLHRVMALRAVAAAERLFSSALPNVCNSTPVPDGRRARDTLRAQAIAQRAPPITAPPPGRRCHQKTTVHMRDSEHDRDFKNHVCYFRPPARPEITGSTRLATDHSSSGAASQDARSPASRAAWRLATSMRPTESEGSRRRRQRG